MISSSFQSIEKKRKVTELLVDDMNFEEQLAKRKERKEVFLDDKKMQ